MSQADVVAYIHSRALPDDVLPNLGHKVLHEYYRRVILDKDQKLSGVTVTDQIINFCEVSCGRNGLIKDIVWKQGIREVAKLFFTKPKMFFLALMQAVKSPAKYDYDAAISFVAVIQLIKGWDLVM